MGPEDVTCNEARGCDTHLYFASSSWDSRIGSRAIRREEIFVQIDSEKLS